MTMSLKNYRVDLEATRERSHGEPKNITAAVGSFYLVLNYLWEEWGIDPMQFPEKVRTRTYQKIRLLLSRNYSVVTTSEKMLKWFWLEGLQRWKHNHV